jgi:hypothetical protein
MDVWTVWFWWNRFGSRFTAEIAAHQGLDVAALVDPGLNAVLQAGPWSPRPRPPQRPQDSPGNIHRILCGS